MLHPAILTLILPISYHYILHTLHTPFTYTRSTTLYILLHPTLYYALHTQPLQNVELMIFFFFLQSPLSLFFFSWRACFIVGRIPTREDSCATSSRPSSLRSTPSWPHLVSRRGPPKSCLTTTTTTNATSTTVNWPPVTLHCTAAADTVPCNIKHIYDTNVKDFYLHVHYLKR